MFLESSLISKHDHFFNRCNKMRANLLIVFNGKIEGSRRGSRKGGRRFDYTRSLKYIAFKRTGRNNQFIFFGFPGGNSCLFCPLFYSFLVGASVLNQNEIKTAEFKQCQTYSRIYCAAFEIEKLGIPL